MVLFILPCDRKEERLISSVPYYIIVIGPAKQVSKFTKSFLSDAPANQVHFGLTVPISYSVLTKRNPKGIIWYSPEDSCCKSIVADMSGGPIEFEVGLKLSNLPSALKAHSIVAPLKVNASNASVSIIGGIKKIPDNDDSNLKGSSHTVRVRVSNLSKNSVIRCTLPPQNIPRWVSTLSLEDDNYPARQQPGTYKLSSIVSGIQEAYNASYPHGLPPVFSLTIQIEKD